MARYDHPFCITRRCDSRFYYFKLSRWDQRRSSGTTSIGEAERIAEAAYLASLASPVGPTLSECTMPYYIRENCPVVFFFADGMRR